MNSSRDSGAPEIGERRWGGWNIAVPITAIGCVLVYLIIALLARPYAESGISDDFSYIRCAQVLAQTGHVVYNGWESPIVGWQLYLAALFIKLFGFSFTTVRASILLIAVSTAFLCQRTFVRAGINEWNASIGTLTLMLSPLCLPLEVTFMTDIPGLFAIVLCTYACLRAIQTQTSSRAIAWLGFAALSNVVFGSSRQIAWLGALVMVPSALWILRRSRRILVAGAGFWLLSAILIFAIEHWFQQQPYSLAEHLFPGPIRLHVISHLASGMIRMFFEVVLVLLPVVLMFLPALYRRSYPWLVYAIGILCVVDGVRLWHVHNLDAWSAPYLSGVAPFSPLTLIRPVFTIAVLFSSLALLTCILTSKDKLQVPPAPSPLIPDRTLAILILPLAISYVGLLMPPAGFESIWDRYVVPIMFIALIFLLRYYQQHFHARLPLAALLLAICFGAYATAMLHDSFAVYRARVAAINEVLASGVPATSISGGWDYDGWTELQHSSHVIDPRMRVPAGVSLPKPTHYGLAHCPWFYCDMFPHVVPDYTISSRPDPGLRRPFAPVPFRTWIIPGGDVYVVRFPDLTVGGQVP